MTNGNDYVIFEEKFCSGCPESNKCKRSIEDLDCCYMEWMFDCDEEPN
jgi:hypothetical protein